MAVDFFGAVLGDRGKAWIDVLHHAVAIDQQKGVGALLNCALEQVQGAGGGAAVVVVDHLRELVRQLAGKGDLIRLPGTRAATLLQAQHTDHLAIHADAGVEHGVDVLGAQALGHFPGARVAHRVGGVDGAARMQGFQVVREAAGVDRFGQVVLLVVAVVGRDRHQALAFEVPDAGAVDLVDIAGTAGNQLGGFLQRIRCGVALARQQQDQLLLGAYPFKVLQLFLLGTLVEFQGDLQAAVLVFQVGGRGCHRDFAEQAVDHHQVAAQQVAIVLFIRLTHLQQAQGPIVGVQGVAHQVMRAMGQLLLDGVMQLIARLGFHQAGVRGTDQGAQFHRRQAELALAVRVQVQQRPACLIKPLETQHTEARRHR
ncbi:hypothetical protein [Pseudomonas sp. 22 E 5]|nr:hypothetical protein [Pseudomonas sp. 22 E 5]